jgi:hypothetical protein
MPVSATSIIEPGSVDAKQPLKRSTIAWDGWHLAGFGDDWLYRAEFDKTQQRT